VGRILLLELEWGGQLGLFILLPILDFRARHSAEVSLIGNPKPELGRCCLWLTLHLEVTRQAECSKTDS
jgi:hypothetical protein